MTEELRSLRAEIDAVKQSQERVSKIFARMNYDTIDNAVEVSPEDLVAAAVTTAPGDVKLNPGVFINDHIFRLLDCKLPLRKFQ